MSPIKLLRAIVIKHISEKKQKLKVKIVQSTKVSSDLQLMESKQKETTLV